MSHRHCLRRPWPQLLKGSPLLASSLLIVLHLLWPKSFSCFPFMCTMVLSLPVESQRGAEKYYSLVLFFHPRAAFFLHLGPIGTKSSAASGSSSCNSPRVVTLADLPGEPQHCMPRPPLRALNRGSMGK